MSNTENSQHRFVAGEYAPRAEDYVRSAVHSGGPDLDQMEAGVREHPGARVLDLGCGGGHCAYRAAPHAGEVVACDITTDMLRAVERTAAERGLGNIRTEQAPAERLPFGDASFDLVLCRFSTHHWNNMQAGLMEARRVLRPGGRAVFVDTVAPPHPALDSHLQAMELLRDASHVRNYTAGEWVAAVERAGFAVRSLTPRRLEMEFRSWTARTRTPEAHVTAIRSLQSGAPEIARLHFRIAEDGGFWLDTLTLVLDAA